jgi:hypothetical protein
MDSGLKTISSLFDGAKKLIIPIYQRTYTWEYEQWKDFWEDVFHHSKGQKYYFGTILLKEAKKKGDFELLEIVDGQQRVTTISIFIFEILNRLKKLDPDRKLKIKEDKYIQYEDNYKLSINDLDNEFFQTYILNNDNSKINYRTPAQRLLSEAKEYFVSKLSEQPIKELDSMLEMLENSEILVYSVKDSAEASLIFETTNDRGKSLTDLEKVKSFLMYRSYLSAGKKKSDIINRIQSRFGEIYQVIERIKPLFAKRGIIEVDEDQICTYHYIGEYEWYTKRDYQRFVNTMKDHLNQLWHENKNKDIIKFIEEYTKSLKESFLTFEAILNYNNKYLNDIIYIRKIAIFFPLLILTHKFDKTKTKVNFNKILQALEKFCFRYFFMNAYRKSDMTYTFHVAAHNFNINKDFKKLEIAIIDKVSWGSKLDSTLRNNNIYQYGNPSLSYLFWKYENYLRTNFQPKFNEMSYEEFNDKSNKFRITIEHITSQTPLNGLRFTKQTEKFEEEYLHCLGNLTIDPQSSNSSKGNEGWDIKKKYYFEKNPFKTQLTLSNYVNPKAKVWGNKAIIKHREDIIVFALEKWGTDWDKKE